MVDIQAFHGVPAFPRHIDPQLVPAVQAIHQQVHALCQAHGVAEGSPLHAAALTGSLMYAQAHHDGTAAFYESFVQRLGDQLAHLPQFAGNRQEAGQAAYDLTLLFYQQPNHPLTQACDAARPVLRNVHPDFWADITRLADQNRLADFSPTVQDIAPEVSFSMHNATDIRRNLKNTPSAASPQVRAALEDPLIAAHPLAYGPEGAEQPYTPNADALGHAIAIRRHAGAHSQHLADFDPIQLRLMKTAALDTGFTDRVQFGKSRYVDRSGLRGRQDGASFQGVFNFTDHESPAPDGRNSHLIAATYDLHQARELPEGYIDYPAPPEGLDDAPQGRHGISPRRVSDRLQRQQVESQSHDGFAHASFFVVQGPRSGGDAFDPQTGPLYDAGAGPVMEWWQNTFDPRLIGRDLNAYPGSTIVPFEVLSLVYEAHAQQETRAIDPGETVRLLNRAEFQLRTLREVKQDDPELATFRATEYLDYLFREFPPQELQALAASGGDGKPARLAAAICEHLEHLIPPRTVTDAELSATFVRYGIMQHNVPRLAQTQLQQDIFSSDFEGLFHKPLTEVSEAEWAAQAPHMHDNRYHSMKALREVLLPGQPGADGITVTGLAAYRAGALVDGQGLQEMVHRMEYFPGFPKRDSIGNPVVQEAPQGIFGGGFMSGRPTEYHHFADLVGDYWAILKGLTREDPGPLPSHVEGMLKQHQCLGALAHNEAYRRNMATLSADLGEQLNPARRV